MKGIRKNSNKIYFNHTDMVKSYNKSDILYEGSFYTNDSFIGTFTYPVLSILLNYEKLNPKSYSNTLLLKICIFLQISNNEKFRKFHCYSGYE